MLGIKCLNSVNHCFTCRCRISAYKSGAAPHFHALRPMLPNAPAVVFRRNPAKCCRFAKADLSENGRGRVAEPEEETDPCGSPSPGITIGYFTQPTRHPCQRTDRRIEPAPVADTSPKQTKLTNATNDFILGSVIISVPCTPSRRRWGSWLTIFLVVSTICIICAALHNLISTR